MTLDGLWFTDYNDKSAECAEQDQTACKCSLILLYTLCNVKPWSRVRKKKGSINHVGSNPDDRTPSRIFFYGT